MTETKQQTGQYGEQLAVDYLVANGYVIRERNWHSYGGEIDIVAMDGSTLVFVEVRTRRTASTDDAFTSITQQKRDRLIKLAYAYLNRNSFPDSAIWRIDVIGIALPRNKPPIVEHIEDALGW